MKITGIKTFLLRHPLPHRIGGATAYVDERRTLLIKVETDAGAVGWGETAPFPAVRALIEEQYTPLLIGRDPAAHRPNWRALSGRAFGNSMAVGGIDIALEDLRGKALGLSVPELYGGRLRDQVEVYVSALNYVEGEDPVELYPRQAAEAMAQGFRALKMRIGGHEISKDMAAAAAVRSAVGDDIRLMADGTGAYSLATAIRVGRELERLGFYFYEEPLPQCTPEYPGYEVLTSTLEIPVAAGEALGTRGRFQAAFDRRVMDIVQPDISLAGGIGECLAVAEMARLSGILCTPHCWAGALVVAATAHLVSLLPDASWSRCTEAPMMEMDLIENRFRDELLTTPLDIRDGRLTVPRGQGLGIEVDEDKVKFYSV